MSRLKQNCLAKDNFAYSNSFHKLYYTKQDTLALKRWVYEADSETDNDSDALNSYISMAS